MKKEKMNKEIIISTTGVWGWFKKSRLFRYLHLCLEDIILNIDLSKEKYIVIQKVSFPHPVMAKLYRKICENVSEAAVELGANMIKEGRENSDIKIGSNLGSGRLEARVEQMKRDKLEGKEPVVN